MHIVRAAEQRAMPWKNGAGVTYEVAVCPADAPTLDDFDWRVSMAQVEADGPFSRFAGIDRSIAIMAGAGLDLVVDGRECTVDGKSPALPFSGDSTAAARLIDGPILDLNVMTRRGVWHHLVARERMAADRVISIAAVSTTMMLILRDGAVDIASIGFAGSLGPRDTLVFAGGERATLTARAPADLFRVELWRTD